jgi:uncharacterized protein YjbI with pentapeptide repeats
MKKVEKVHIGILQMNHLVDSSFHLASFRLASFHLASFRLASFHLASFHLAAFHLASFHLASFHLAAFQVFVDLNILLKNIACIKKLSYCY